MKSKLFYLFFSILSLLLSKNAFSEQFPLNKIGCFIVNDGYFQIQGYLLKGNLVKLHKDSTRKQTIYKNNNLTLEITSSTVTEVALKQPWVSSFKLEALENGHKTVSVTSAPRNSEIDSMSVHLAISSPDPSNNGELIIECNARQ